LRRPSCPCLARTWRGQSRRAADASNLGWMVGDSELPPVPGIPVKAIPGEGIGLGSTDPVVNGKPSVHPGNRVPIGVSLQSAKARYPDGRKG
jgi:hypothetical protein